MHQHRSVVNSHAELRTTVSYLAVTCITGANEHARSNALSRQPRVTQPLSADAVPPIVETAKSKVTSHVDAVSAAGILAG